MIIGWICLISCMNQSEQMSAKVEAIAKEVGGTLNLYALNLKTKKGYGIREDSPCRTASTINSANATCAATDAVTPTRDCRCSNEKRISTGRSEMCSGVLRHSTACGFGDG